MSDSGAVTGWLDLGVGDKSDYHKVGTIATGSSVSPNDTIWLADFTGEGRSDDYLYINWDGKVAWWEHQGDNPITWGAAALAADKKIPNYPTDVRFADINGDGLADYIVISHISGAATMWENLGVNPEDRTINWGEPQSIADGTSPGRAIQIFDIGQNNPLNSPGESVLTILGHGRRSS